MKQPRWVAALQAFAAITAAAAPGPACAAEGTWVRFTDPAEHAFSLQVPRGWKVSGGLYRFGPLDPRLMVEMISPDGRIELRIGDAGVPPFAVPNATLLSTGFREGSRYSPNGVAQEVVARYRPGWAFADLYGQARFSGRCRSLELKQLQRAQPIHEVQAAQLTAGEAVFRCAQDQAAPSVAYAFAETQLTYMQTAGIWQVTGLYSFIAPESEAANAMKKLLHAIVSVQIDQQWESYQLRLNGQAGENAYHIFQQTVAQEHERYERQEAQFQQQVDRFDRALRGVTLTVDPVGNVPREVWTGPHANNWMTPANTVVNATFAPTPDSRLLKPRD